MLKKQAETVVTAKRKGRETLLKLCREGDLLLERSFSCNIQCESSLRQAVSVYEKALAYARESERRLVLAPLAKAYFRGYFTKAAARSYQNHQWAQQAIPYFRELIASDVTVTVLYRFALLLYRDAHDFTNPEPFQQKKRQQQEAYAIYDRTIRTVKALPQEEKADFAGIYVRSCYGLCRSGLELLPQRSLIGDECRLLFPRLVSDNRDQEGRTALFKRCYEAIDTARREEKLPRKVIDLQRLISQEQSFEQAWDIYYLLGKLFDYGWQYDLHPHKNAAYDAALKYYHYAASFDLLRRRSGRSVHGFFYMYESLLLMTLRGRDLDKYRYLWKTYEMEQLLPQPHRDLLNARFHIINDECERAAALLLPYAKKTPQQAGLSPRKATALLDIITIIRTASLKKLRGTYKPYQFVWLHKIRDYVQKKKPSADSFFWLNPLQENVFPDKQNRQNIH